MKVHSDRRWTLGGKWAAFLNSFLQLNSIQIAPRYLLSNFYCLLMISWPRNRPDTYVIATTQSLPRQPRRSISNRLKGTPRKKHGHCTWRNGERLSPRIPPLAIEHFDLNYGADGEWPRANPAWYKRSTVLCNVPKKSTHGKGTGGNPGSYPIVRRWRPYI